MGDLLRVIVVVVVVAAARVPSSASLKEKGKKIY